MRPAFSSTKQAVAFALLLLVTLLSPVLAGKKFLPPREQAYASQSWGSGPYPWIENQIFQETNDIDIVFIGSSHIIHAVDTPYVQAQLSEKLGRPAVARTLAWGGAGYDGLFFIARDLLAHRKVRMLVFYDENPAPGHRHNQMPGWFRFGEDAGLLSGLSSSEQGYFYFTAVIGMPRNLLNLARNNLPAPLISNPPNYWEQHYGSASIVKLLGCTCSELGFNYDKLGDHFTAFTPFTPQTAATSADTEIYSPAATNDFQLGREPLPAWQVHFAGKLSELAQTHGCRLVMLTIPVLADAPVAAIRERASWPEIFHGDFWMIGIPPAKLFAGLTDQQLHWLFTNSGHFNKNGMTYFTPLITPALLQIYETAGKHEAAGLLTTPH
jgi:hypothetical protein